MPLPDAGVVVRVPHGARDVAALSERGAFDAGVRVKVGRKPKCLTAIFFNLFSLLSVGALSKAIEFARLYSFRLQIPLCTVSATL